MKYYRIVNSDTHPFIWYSESDFRVSYELFYEKLGAHNIVEFLDILIRQGVLVQKNMSVLELIKCKQHMKAVLLMHRYSGCSVSVCKSEVDRIAKKVEQNES